MACTITITTNNGNRVEMEVPSLPNSLSELKDIIRSSGKLEELHTYIKQAVGEGNTIKNVKLSEIKDTSGIIPNATVSLLKERFPEAGFPEEDLDDIPILYINQYKVSDSELQFGIFEQNGKQYFVIDNNESHIKDFAAYLSLKNAIEKDNLLQNKLTKKEFEILENCRKASNYSSIEQMSLEFLNNRSIFRNFRTEDNQSVFSLLNDVLSKVSERTRKRRFTDPTANEFYLRLSKIGENTWKINLEELYEQVLMFDDNIKKVIPDSFTEFKKFLKSEDIPNDFSLLLGDSSNKLDSIINYIVSKEPWLNMSYQKTVKNDIILKNEFPNIKRVYGIGYDTIKKMTQQKYRGMYIYSDGNKFYPSEWMLSESTRTLAYDSVEEARNHIDELINKQKLVDYNFVQIYTKGEGRRILNKRIPTKTLIELKDYNLKINFIQNRKENEILQNGTMQDFYDYISKLDSTGEIIKYIQNAQEAVLFLYKKNELGSKADLIQIAKEIHNSPLNYYYVEESYVDSIGNKYHRLLPAKDVKIEEVKENYKTPVLSLFNAISNQFSSKFGIQVEILNDEEVKSQYGIEDAKAFILRNKIILNSTLASSDDIFHEYAHLVLGYLKYKNPENYRKLIQSVWNKMYSGNKNVILNKYKNLPREAQLEEGFVFEFGKYISNNLINNDLQGIFKEQEGFLKEGVSSIFDGEVNISKIFGSSLNSVFNRFNSEIGHLLNSDDDFLSFTKSNDFFLQRKKVNWLEKQIELEKIKEIC